MFYYCYFCIDLDTHCYFFIDLDIIFFIFILVFFRVKVLYIFLSYCLIASLQEKTTYISTSTKSTLNNKYNKIVIL